MRNIHKFILLIIVGALIFWAYDSFRADGYSQTNTVSNKSTIGAVTSATPTGLNDGETAGEITQSKSREGACGSGFNEIPVELQRLYTEQTAQFEAEKLSEPLKNEVDYYGFIYPRGNPNGGQQQCPDEPPVPKEINFVKPQVNDLIKMYISAVIDNESKIIAAKRKMTGNLPVENKIDLCIGIECGKKNFVGESKSFNFKSVEDLEYARIFSDTQLYSSALNKIRSGFKLADDSQEFADSEINQMLAAAGKIAAAKVKPGN